MGDKPANDVSCGSRELADRTKVYDDDLIALMSRDQGPMPRTTDPVKSLRVVCGTEGPQTADLVLTVDGTEHAVHAEGDGPVDAAFRAVRELVPKRRGSCSIRSVR